MGFQLVQARPVSLVPSQDLALTNSGRVSVSAPISGNRQVITVGGGNHQPVQAVETRQVSAAAVPQTDFLDVNIAAGASLVVQLGEVHGFYDLSSTIISANTILMIDPNGTDHELNLWTRTKTTQHDLPSLPPGTYKFRNVSGGAITGKALYVIHIGARNNL